MRARTAAACRRTILLRSSSAASRKGSSAIERFSISASRNRWRSLAASACQLDSTSASARAGSRRRTDVRIASRSALLPVCQTRSASAGISGVATCFCQSAFSVASHSPRWPSAAKIDSERRGCRTHQSSSSGAVAPSTTHAVRTRELGPFLDQPGVEIAEKPDQRGDRRCGRSRPIVAADSLAAGRYESADAIRRGPALRASRHP